MLKIILSLNLNKRNLMFSHGYTLFCFNVVSTLPLLIQPTPFVPCTSSVSAPTTYQYYCELLKYKRLYINKKLYSRICFILYIFFLSNSLQHLQNLLPNDTALFVQSPELWAEPKPWQDYSEIYNMIY